MAEGGDAVPFDQMQPIDQYILAKTAELTAKKVQAISRSYEWGEQIPVGIYYKVDRPTYGDEVRDFIAKIDAGTEVFNVPGSVKVMIETAK